MSYMYYMEREREREREREILCLMFSESFFKHREYQMSQSKKINDRRKTRTCIAFRVLKYGEKNLYPYIRFIYF